MAMRPLTAAERYYKESLSRLEKLLDGQRPDLDRAASLCTEAIAEGGLVHLFGCGHSRMMCEEMTPRQGCFVGWHTIVELGLTFHNLIVGPNGLRQSLHLEKTLGYAEQILRNFAFGPHDVLIVISTSGIREVIVEMAEGAKKRGLAVIGLVENFSPIDSLSSGRAITWSELGFAFGQIVLLPGGVLALVGIGLFQRRELATAQGTQ